MTKKKRADEIVFELGLAESRDKAARMIMAGQVLLAPDNNPEHPVAVNKPGDLLPANSRLQLKEKSPYVSRGAYKLLTALEHFHLEARGLICLDAGASTGGFTDCLLQRGAARVYAVDVGTAQLHEKLKADPRVISMENTNLRLAGPDLLPEPMDMAVADLSFISLKAVLPAILQYLKPDGSLIALIKPQFELGGENTVKGVVKDENLRRLAVEGVTEFAATLGLKLHGVIPAAITGPKGNQEYLAYWEYN